MMTLYRTVIYGPKRDETYYPDPRKLELVVNYVTGACRQNLIMRNAFIDIATSQWSVVEETLYQVTADIYQFPGDECLADNAAMTRISSSLQVAASGLNLLLELIQYQLLDREEGKIRQEPVMRAFRECEGGIRGALKFITRMSAIAWTRHGHFLLFDNGTELDLHVNVEPTIVQSCSKQARQVLQTLAKLTSYTAWMYSLDQGLNMGEKSFCSTVVDVLNCEWSSSTTNVNPYIDRWERTISHDDMSKYLEKMKLRFVLDLTLVEKEWSGPFHLVVADLLGLRQKYKHVLE
jgi:hypothetical protein